MRGRGLIRACLVAGLVSMAGQVPADEDPLLQNQKMIQQVIEETPRIGTAELKELIDSEADFVLLDVRMPSEIRMMGVIDAPQQLEIPRGWLEMRVFQVVDDREMPIVVYCGKGVRSAFATRTLREMGFTDVRNYAEGFLGWQEKGYPVRH